MHPQASDKREVCKGFFEALQACHTNSWSYWTGGCNGLKDELNLCLRRERLRRAEVNREDAKVRQAKTAKAWQDMREYD